MARASGAYKRWTKWWLFGIGLLIAIVANASAFHVAERLWADPPTRSAVVSSAGQVAQQTDPSQNIPDVAHATSRLEELKLPIGWDAPSRGSWNDLDDYWSWRPYIMLLGWIVTGLLVTLGAPFWFNLLTQLASLRSTGAKPPPAAQDGASATSLQQDLTSAAPTVFAVRPPAPEPGVQAEVGAVPAARGGPPPPRRSASQKAAAAFGLRAHAVGQGGIASTTRTPSRRTALVSSNRPRTSRAARATSTGSVVGAGSLLILVRV